MRYARLWPKMSLYSVGPLCVCCAFVYKCWCVFTWLLSFLTSSSTQHSRNNYAFQWPDTGYVCVWQTGRGLINLFFLLPIVSNHLLRKAIVVLFSYMHKTKLDAKETVFQYNNELNNEFEFDYLRLSIKILR